MAKFFVFVWLVSRVEADPCAPKVRAFYHFTSLSQWKLIENSGAVLPMREDVLALLSPELREQMAQYIHTAIFAFERENFNRAWTESSQKMPVVSTHGRFEISSVADFYLKRFVRRVAIQLLAARNPRFAQEMSWDEMLNELQKISEFPDDHSLVLVRLGTSDQIHMGGYRSYIDSLTDRRLQSPEDADLDKRMRRFLESFRSYDTLTDELVEDEPLEFIIHRPLVLVNGPRVENKISFKELIDFYSMNSHPTQQQMIRLLFP